MFVILVAILASTQPPAAISGDMRERLALAEQYIALSHRVELTRRTYAQQLRMMPNRCASEACRTQLSADIDTATDDAMTAYRRGVGLILARRLTVKQLKAAVAFEASPDGKAIVGAMDGATSDFATLHSKVYKDVSTSLLKSFCSHRPGDCARAP